MREDDDSMIRGFDDSISEKHQIIKSSNHRIIVLLDEKPGNRSQALGVAERLAECGASIAQVELRGTRLADLPSFALGAHLWGYDGESRRKLRQRRDAPDLILAAGRRLIPAMRFLKQRYPRARLAYLMHPKRRLKDFDLVAIPEHDRPKSRANLLLTLGSVHRLRAERLRAEAPPPSVSPRIAVLVGGKAKGAVYDEDDWERLASELRELARGSQGQLWVSTSRRTGQAATGLLRAALPEAASFHAWTPGGENPYFDFLAAAEAVVVTGESMSMLSEACALGVPVFVFNPKRPLSPKHRRLQQAITERGYLRPLDNQASLDWSPPAPLDEAGRVAEALWAMLQNPKTATLRT